MVACGSCPTYDLMIVLVAPHCLVAASFLCRRLSADIQYGNLFLQVKEPHEAPSTRTPSVKTEQAEGSDEASGQPPASSSLDPETSLPEASDSTPLEPSSRPAAEITGPAYASALVLSSPVLDAAALPGDPGACAVHAQKDPDCTPAASQDRPMQTASAVTS